MKENLLVLLLLTILVNPIETYAASSSYQEPDQIRSTFATVKNRCMPSEGILENSCQYIDNRESQYDTKLFALKEVTIDLRLLSRDSNHRAFFIQDAAIFIGKKFLFIGDKINKNLISSGYKSAKSEYHHLVKEMKAYARDHNMDSEQKLGLVHCLSSNLITYSKFNEGLDMYHDGETCDILAKGAGMCRQFTTVAYDLAKELGLQVTRGHGEGHAYLIAHLNNKWFSTEPQSERCELFPLKSSKFLNAIYSHLPFLIHKIPVPRVRT